MLYELARSSDVFLTNFLPDARTRLHIDVDDIRAVNPDIIYVRGSAFGARGARGDAGRLRRHRVLGARAATPPGCSRPTTTACSGMPGPAYGDSIGGMTIAGGIAAALLARERTGEPSVVDVSLLGVGRLGDTARRSTSRSRTASRGRAARWATRPKRAPTPGRDRSAPPTAAASTSR